MPSDKGSINARNSGLHRHSRFNYLIDDAIDVIYGLPSRVPTQPLLSYIANGPLLLVQVEISVGTLSGRLGFYQGSQDV